MEVLNRVGLDYLIYKIKGSYDKLGTDIGKGLGERVKQTINITYAELVSLRDSANLKPGQQYRITDYVTTTRQENTVSASNVFDIIVTADSTNTLNEEARACLHEGDHYFLNAGAKLEAWKIWYCLDNDTERFAWALNKAISNGDATFYRNPLLDTTNNDVLYYAWFLENENVTVYTSKENPTEGEFVYDDTFAEDWQIQAIVKGKGVIYRMIDEWNNDCPYDFKNIQFASPLKKETYVDMYYTFSGIHDDGSIIDVSITQNIFYNSNVVNNILHASYNNDLRILLCNLFIITNEYNGDIAKCTFHHNCRDNLIIGAVSDITFDRDCYENLLQTHAENRPHSKIYFAYDCYKNTLLGQACNVQLGAECTNNTFQSYSYDIVLSHKCSNNIFEGYVYGLTMGQSCSDNIFKQKIQDARLSFLCSNNTFNGMLGSVIMDNTCSNNIFARLEGVTIGRQSKNNNYSGLIAMTTIGGQHSYNIGTQTIKYCTIGANVQYNSFGIAMTGMNIGHDVNNIYFSNDGTLDNLIDSSTYTIQYSTICSNTCYTVFIMDEEHKTIQHSDIFTVGTEDSMKNVQIQVSDNNYKIKITTNSQGEIKQYCEADLIA